MWHHVRRAFVLLLAFLIPYASVVTATDFIPHSTDAFEEALAALAAAGTSQDIIAYDPDLGEPDSETQAILSRLQSDNPDAIIIPVPAREKLHAQIIEQQVPDESGLPFSYATELVVESGNHGLLEADIGANLERLLAATPAYSTLTKASSGVAAMADLSLITGNLEQLYATGVPELDNSVSAVQDCAADAANGLLISIVAAGENGIAVKFLLDGPIVVHEDGRVEATEETYRAIFTTLVDTIPDPSKLAEILVATGLIVTSPKGLAHETVSTVERKLFTVIIGLMAAAAVTYISAGTLGPAAFSVFAAYMAAEKAAELAFDVHDIITSLRYSVVPIGLSTTEAQDRAVDSLGAILGAHPDNQVWYEDARYPQGESSAAVTTFLKGSEVTGVLGDQLRQEEEVSETLNAPPIAVDDEATNVNEDATFARNIRLDVIQNDEDPNGDPLSAIIDENPQHGKVISLEDGDLLYIPEEGFVGLDRFTYFAFDGIEQSARAARVLLAIASPVRPTILVESVEACECAVCFGRWRVLAPRIRAELMGRRRGDHDFHPGPWRSSRTTRQTVCRT